MGSVFPIIVETGSVVHNPGYPAYEYAHNHALKHALTRHEISDTESFWHTRGSYFRFG